MPTGNSPSIDAAMAMSIDRARHIRMQTGYQVWPKQVFSIPDPRHDKAGVLIDVGIELKIFITIKEIKEFMK